MSEKIIIDCDVTGEPGALPVYHATHFYEIDSPTGRKEYQQKRIDLSHKAAIDVIYALLRKLHLTATWTREEEVRFFDSLRRK